MMEAGEPEWRGRQLAEAIYRQRVTDLDAITTLPKALRQRLVAEGWQVGRPRLPRSSNRWMERSGIWSRARAAKALTVETVWMPEGDDGEAGDGSRTWRPSCLQTRQGRGEAQRRATICVSSQVGCAVNCQFCLTAKLGLQRNLSAGEIAGQVVAVFDRHKVEVGRDRVNLVFMGMGEPFLNYDSFMGAVRLLVDRSRTQPPAHDGIDVAELCRASSALPRSRPSSAPSWPSA